MSRKSILFLVLFLVALHLTLYTLHGSCGGPGTTGAAFLKVGAGARAVGMGEAFTAVADDVTSIYWNPAGLNSVTNIEASFTYNMWLLDTSQSFIAYGQRLTQESVLGASVIYLGYGSMTYMTDGGVSGAAFSPGDLAVGVAYARQLKNLSLGATVKIIYETLDPADAQGSSIAVGFDIGAIYYPEKLPNLTAGVALQNLGTPLKFISEAPLPAALKAGVSYKVLAQENLEGSIIADLIVPFDNKMALHAGMEIWIQKMFAVRAGYKTDSMMDINPLAGFCFGGGFKWQDYCADISYTPAGELGNPIRITVGAKF